MLLTTLDGSNYYLCLYICKNIALNTSCSLQIYCNALHPTLIFSRPYFIQCSPVAHQHVACPSWPCAPCACTSWPCAPCACSPRHAVAFGVAVGGRQSTSRRAHIWGSTQRKGKDEARTLESKSRQGAICCPLHPLVDVLLLLFHAHLEATKKSLSYFTLQDLAARYLELGTLHNCLSS